MLLRPARSDDAAAVADVWLRSFAVALPTVRRTHSDDQVRAWIRDVLIADRETWVAEVDGMIVGIMSLADDWVEQLYIDPDWQGQGIGASLINLAKSHQPSGLQLWTFQVNEAARAFYKRHSFVVVDRTDGEGNEEQEPDLRLVWIPDAPGPAEGHESAVHVNHPRP